MRFWVTSLAIFVQFLGFATSAAHRELRDTANEAENPIVCMTPECRNTAARIILDLDITKNPCDDFYEFSCGSFLQTKLSRGTVMMTGRKRAKTQFKSQLKRLFEADNNVDDIRPVKLTKTLYKTCMNEASIEYKGVLPLKNLIRMLGGWPVVEGISWNETNFHWMATTAIWTRAGLPSVTFMDIGIGQDIANISQRALYVAPPPWDISPHYLNEGFNTNTVIMAYYTMMVDVAVSFGVDRKTAEDELKEALLFHIELSKEISAAKSEVLRWTLKTLIERCPLVDWRDTFARLYSPTQTIGDDDVVTVENPMFINSVVALVSRTPKRVLANFAMFQIIPSKMRDTNLRTIEKLNAYDLTRHMYVERDPRWVYCTDQVINTMPASVTYMYTHVENILKPGTKAKFEDMIQRVREEFRANVDKIPLLDATTRASTKNKEGTITTVVGHPNQLLDNDGLVKYYEKLHIHDDHLSNILFLSKFEFDRLVGDFRKPMNYVNSAEEYRQLLTGIGYANRYLNRIILSAATLQGDLFNPERPDYMNFGTSGTTIAHEITHLFDAEGKLWTPDGINNGYGIFTIASEQLFQEQVRCFQYQYGNYTEQSINRGVDGVATLNENIADNAGVKRAYHAYVNTMSGKTPEKRLPGLLNYTPNQMFWIAYANKNCDKRTLSYMQYTWRRDPHAIGRFRVTGPLSNSEEFSADFNCAPGSKMNPVKKCSMW